MPPDSLHYSPRITATSQAVTAAARGVFLSLGYENASMDGIAREAQVSKATLYAHFASKEILFFAVMQAEIADYKTRLEAIANDGKGNFAKRLTKVGTSLLEFLIMPSTLQMFRLVIADGVRVPEVCQTVLGAGRQRTRQIVADIFRDGITTGTLDGHDPEEAAHLFLAMLKGELPWECLVNPHNRPTKLQISGHVRDLVRHMLTIYGAPDSTSARSPHNSVP